MSDDVKTYRGRSLAEILPQIREELGDDAVVLRRREGVAGGVGGFFAKAFIEVEARAGTPRLDVRDDGAEELPALPAAAPARARGLEDVLREAASAMDAAPAPASSVPPALGAAAAASPAAELAAFADALAAEPAATEAAAPVAGTGFARLLADAYAGGFGGGTAPAVPAAEEAFAPDVLPAAPDEALPAVPDALPEGLEREALPALAAAENHRTADAAPTGAEEVAPVPVHAAKAAAAAQTALVDAGCSPAFAAGLVAEAVSHGLPFATPRSLRRLVREALVRRVPVAPPRGAHAVVALVGASGCGRTTAAARLAAAYSSGSDLAVRAVALRAADGGAELASLVPEGVAASAATAAEAAELAEAAGARALVVLDVPAVAPRDEASVRTLRREVRQSGATEVHVVLPATTSAPVARALLAAVRPLKPAGILLTHAEEVAGLGSALELAAAEGLPLSWQSTSGTIGPADVAGLAAEVLR